MGIELGLPPGVDTSTARQMIEAALGEMLLIVRLPESSPVGAGPLSLAAIALQSGAGALSLGPPRGLAWQTGSRSKQPDLIEGRIFGPAVLPTALYCVHELAGAGLPVIGSGGIYSDEAVQAMLAAGASAVQVDTALWRRMAWLF
jgi:dihydroorotate dehydrogenase (NAD+) catalytic subunit